MFLPICTATVTSPEPSTDLACSKAVRSDVSVGDSQLLGQSADGWNVSDRVRDTPPGATSTLTIDLDVGAGAGRVCRASQADDDRHCSE